MQVSLGQCHTVASTGRGKAYIWGWNDNGQCGRDPMMCDEVVIKSSSKTALMESVHNDGQGIKAKQLLAVEDRCMMIS